MTKKNAALAVLTALILIGLCGCEPKSNTKVDMAKSFDTVKAEAAKMNVEQLRKKALAFKNAIDAKGDDITKVMQNMNAQSAANTGDGIKLNNKTEIDSFMQTIGDLKKRYDIYISYLKEKNGDLTGLSLK
jgi:hypothetical protein